MKQQAFTLVELSIVLVILGLLVGGVLTGQSLIHAAELRAVTNEYQRYTTAVHTFRDKYFALPGDMTNAVRYWGQMAGGTADGIDATCIANTTISTGTPTCNGDGDGQISNASGSFEQLRFWQHLANAGLIEGSYSGVSESGGMSGFSMLFLQIGANIPASRLAPGGWSVIYTNALAASDAYPTDASNFSYPHPGGNDFFFGALAGNNTTRGGIIKPEDAYNIDKKLDDGVPGSGAVLADTPNDTAYYMPGGQCSTTLYLLNVATPTCSLEFKLGL